MVDQWALLGYFALMFLTLGVSACVSLPLLWALDKLHLTKRLNKFFNIED